MVDYFALALSHSLLLFAAWHLLWRGDLDQDPARDGGEPRQNKLGGGQQGGGKPGGGKHGGGRSPAPRPPGLRPRA